MIPRPESSLSACPYTSSAYRLAFLIALFLCLSVLLSSCAENNSPESISADFIERCESIIEKRQLRKLKNLVSELYLDQQGRNKQNISAISAGYILRNKNIHIYSRLISAAKNGNQIKATILTAIAGAPIYDTSMLPSLNADMYWFDVVLVEKDGDWLIAYARWRQAMLDDFF